MLASSQPPAKTNLMRLFSGLFFAGTIIITGLVSVSAQNTNPVEKEVANPLTDTPNVNPVAPEQKITTVLKKRDTGFQPEGGGDEIVVYSDRQSAEGEEGKRIVIHEGNVDVRYGVYRMQADKITIYEETQNIVAEGNVIFESSRIRQDTQTRQMTATCFTSPPKP